MLKPEKWMYKELKGNAFGVTNRINWRRYSNALEKYIEYLESKK